MHCFIIHLFNIPPRYRLWTCPYYIILYILNLLWGHFITNLINMPPPPPYQLCSYSVFNITDLIDSPPPPPQYQLRTCSHYSILYTFNSLLAISSLTWLNQYVSSPPNINCGPVPTHSILFTMSSLLAILTPPPPNINYGPAPTTVFYLQWVHYWPFHPPTPISIVDLLLLQYFISLT